MTKAVDGEEEMVSDPEEETETNEPVAEKRTSTTAGTGFTMIGEVIPTKLKAVAVPAAEWVRNAASFSNNLSSRSDVQSLCPLVSDATIAKLIENGIDSLFPVQTQLIPFLIRQLRASASIRPRDICVSSPTGSGKTLAFVIPIIEFLRDKVTNSLKAVVVVPVGELGAQIYDVFNQYTAGQLRVLCSTGKSFLFKDLERVKHVNYDVLITTPGRLVELMNACPELDLSAVQILVMDEADRLSSSDFDINWLTKFEDAVNEHRNACCVCCVADGSVETSVAFTTACSLMSYNGTKKPVVKWLFSATLTPDSFDDMNLFRPKLFTATPESGCPVSQFVIPAELSEKLILVDESRKPLFLMYLILALKFQRILCFTGSLENTHRLVLLLRRVPGIKAGEFSSSLPLKYRNEKLAQFRSGELDILISSDIIARGLDVEVQYVLNYDIPRQKEAYIHRIGRTARAGKTGTALTMATKREHKLFKRVWRQVHGTGVPIPTLDISDSDLEPYVPAYETGLQGLAKDVRSETIQIRSLKNKVYDA